MKVPASNPLTVQKVMLGKTLFFDKKLGSDKACADCHRPDRGWADGVQRSTRATGRLNSRHTPSLLNVGYQRNWGWDGRSPTLEAHVMEEWTAQLAATPAEAAKRIGEDAGYDALFKAAFGDYRVTPERIAGALASFVRSLRSGNAPYDRFENGDTEAISASAKRGWLVFRDKAGCATCHVPPMFTDHRFHNVGIGFAEPSDAGVSAGSTPDLGRFDVTKRKRDQGGFKTPSLRSVSLTAPYFHDGSAATLEGAMAYMLSGGHDNPQRDTSLTKVELTPEQRADLLAFLQSLQGAAPSQ